MGKSSQSAPDPDPNIGKAALKQAETGEKWLAFATDAFKVSQERQVELDELTKRVTEQQLGLATDQAKWSREDRKRYEEQFRPVEDEFIKEATNYATEDRQNEAAAEARADVQAAAANQRAITERQSASLGINPASGRFAGVQASTDQAATLAEATAANTARQTVRDKGLALKADVANLGRGNAATAAAGASGAVGSGAAALAGNQATNAQSMQAAGIMSNGFGGAMQGYAGMGSTLNQQYGLQLEGWRTEQQLKAQNAAGIGSFLGGVIGLVSDEDAKENKTPIPDGEALAAIRELPIEEWDYKDGVEDGGRHFGTYAQDFQEVTGKGDGKMIPIVDAIGVTMKAVQDLDAKLDTIGNAIGLGQDDAAAKPAVQTTPKIRQKKGKVTE